MKVHELRQISDVELQKRIHDEEENLSNLRFQKVIGQLENPMKLGLIRKDVARMKTILRERSLAAAKSAAVTEQPK
ncbi:MAG TPA: 50S ribosomal protein L29 [Bacteroidota bacterium]|nr:50S ribosomal protein L29 [Bacteroidota bacterium]